MSQTTIDFSGDPTGDELLDDLLTPMQHNFLSGHSGTSRPSYAEQGTEWLDTTSTPWILKRFDGSDDIIVGYINATTNIFTPAGLILDKVDATTAPTINDDNADGYGVGSKWVDTTADRAYINVDASTGAAVWKEISGSINGPVASVDSEFALFSGTSGRVLKRATGTGYVKVASGVMGTPAPTIPLADLALQAANSIVSNSTNASAAPTAVTISANKLVGRGASGSIGEITLDSSLSMTGTTLSANLPADGSASVKGVVKVDGTTITASGGVISAPLQLPGAFTVGAYSICTWLGTSPIGAGGTTAGSSIIPFSVGGVPSGVGGSQISEQTDFNPSGTWRAMQSAHSNSTFPGNPGPPILFQRIA